MKKLITIALLTLSTFSLMAEFPVRKDNFNRFSSTKDWENHEFVPEKYKISHCVEALQSKNNGKLVIIGYDKNFFSQIVVFDCGDGNLAAYIKNTLDNSEYCSSSTLTQELTNGNNVYTFSFDESDVQLCLSALDDGYSIFAWKLWQKNQ